MASERSNEREGTRAKLRNTRTSAFKIREVLDLVRNLPVGEARDILRFSERDAAGLVLKLLDSAVANAENNDGLIPDELYVASCFADEGRTFKTFRPRARGRAGRIRKRTAHITIIVARLPESRLAMVKAKQDRAETDRRGRRVAASQQTGGRRRRVGRGRDKEAAQSTTADEVSDDLEAGDVEADEARADAIEADEVESDEVKADDIVDQEAPAETEAAASSEDPAESADAPRAEDEEK